MPPLEVNLEAARFETRTLAQTSEEDHHEMESGVEKSKYVFSRVEDEDTLYKIFQERCAVTPTSQDQLNLLEKVFEECPPGACDQFMEAY